MAANFTGVIRSEPASRKPQQPSDAGRGVGPMRSPSTSPSALHFLRPPGLEDSCERDTVTPGKEKNEEQGTRTSPTLYPSPIKEQNESLSCSFRFPWPREWQSWPVLQSWLRGC